MPTNEGDQMDQQELLDQLRAKVNAEVERGDANPVLANIANELLELDEEKVVQAMCLGLIVLSVKMEVTPIQALEAFDGFAELMLLSQVLSNISGESLHDIAERLAGPKAES